METTNELLMNADIAFSNKQYTEALKWYQKALDIEPNNIYALSRAGAICVPLGKFEEALVYFSKAKELDPYNGDNAFNYANACFFNKDYAASFAGYVQAEKLGCSDDVTPRLYYQMALLCSMNQDTKSALVYFQKCEESDKNGLISLNPDLISEKLKLYMLIENHTKAEECAAQLVAIAPTDFKAYMVYFSILMAKKNYDVAEKVLHNAKLYADMDDNGIFTLDLQIAALYVAKGDANPDMQNEYCKQAIKHLKQTSEHGNLTDEQYCQLVLALAEVYNKVGEPDNAIKLLKPLLSDEILEPEMESIELYEPKESEDDEIDPDKLDEMLDADLDHINDLIETGAIDDDLAYMVESNIDEDGNEYHIYNPSTFNSLDDNLDSSETEPALAVDATNRTYDLTTEFKEKVLFTMLACYMAKDDFKSSQKLADKIKHSDNKYYAYFGLYASALTERKLTGDSDSTNTKYAQAIAFFRNRTFADKQDSLALVFRARLYAEQGKFEKAIEIANLLADADRQVLMNYVESCRKEQ